MGDSRVSVSKGRHVGSYLSSAHLGLQPSAARWFDPIGPIVSNCMVFPLLKASGVSTHNSLLGLRHFTSA